MKITIYMCAIDHKHGTNMYAEASPEALEARIYQYVCEWWDDWAQDEDPKPESFNEKEDAIAHYFDNMAGAYSCGEWRAYDEDTIDLVLNQESDLEDLLAARLILDSQIENMKIKQEQRA